MGVLLLPGDKSGGWLVLQAGTRVSGISRRMLCTLLSSTLPRTLRTLRRAGGAVHLLPCSLWLPLCSFFCSPWCFPLFLASCHSSTKTRVQHQLLRQRQPAST